MGMGLCPSEGGMESWRFQASPVRRGGDEVDGEVRATAKWCEAKGNAK